MMHGQKNTKLSCLQFEIWTQNLRQTNQKCYPLDIDHSLKRDITCIQTRQESQLPYLDPFSNITLANRRTIISVVLKDVRGIRWKGLPFPKRGKHSADVKRALFC